MLQARDRQRINYAAHQLNAEASDVLDFQALDEWHPEESPPEPLSH